MKRTLDRRTFSQLLAMSLAATATLCRAGMGAGEEAERRDWSHRHHVAGAQRSAAGGVVAVVRLLLRIPRSTKRSSRTCPSSGSPVSNCSTGRSTASKVRGCSADSSRNTSCRSISSYTSVNLTDPAQRADTIAAAVAVGKIMKKYGGKTIVIGPSGRVGGESYNYNDHKQNIVTTLNELGKAITDIGLIAALHQHTGTAVETRDETYATMEAVDTRYVKFGPDIGQLLKGGVDPVPVVKTFLPVVQHMHFKDWVGGPSMAGYCPLGLGKVDLVGILDLMEGRKLEGMIMVELDRGGEMPYTPRETAQIAHGWLVKNGVTMRA